MAVVCELTDGTTTIDFTTASGFELLDTYIPKIATPTGDGSLPPYVVEVLPCRVVDTSDDALATTLQDMAALMRAAAQYRDDQTQETRVWFHMKLYDELGERRALVRSINLSPAENWFLHCTTGTDGYWIPIEVVIERHPYWERDSARDFPQALPTAAASIAYDHTAAGAAVGAHDIVGDVDARIRSLSFRPVNVGDKLGQLWMGFRSANKHGTLGNFVNIWECEDGSLVTDAALGPDGTASPGGVGNTKVTVTPGTATWALRMRIILADVSANESDNFGDFMWLLRAQVSAGTWEVQLRFGYTGVTSANLLRSETVEIIDTAWNFFNMGTQIVPIRDLHVFPTANLSDSWDQEFMIEIWARRTVGAGTLDLDCLCPVPVDEGYAIVDNFLIFYDTPITDSVGIAESPEGTYGAYSTDRDTNGFNAFPTVDAWNFRPPPGDGRLIIVYSQGAASVLSDEISISAGDGGKYYERWISLRGNE